MSTEHQASPADIPNCSCGARRVYEFQVVKCSFLSHVFSNVKMLTLVGQFVLFAI